MICNKGSRIRQVVRLAATHCDEKGVRVFQEAQEAEKAEDLDTRRPPHLSLVKKSLKAR